MKIKIIKTEEEYNTALNRIEKLIDIDPIEGTKEADELALLSLIVSKYEDEHYHIDMPDPVEAIKFRMEQEGLSQKDLVQYIGSKSKVSEVLNRKRSLSINMIRNLSKGLGISAEVLLKESTVQKSA